MSSKAKFILLCGLPASGKSTVAFEIASRESAEIISSDMIRYEMYGDERIQDNPSAVFAELYKRARKTLESGKSVIIDATNISSKKRINALRQFNKYYKVCYYMNTPRDVCSYMDACRARQVGDSVIDKMYRGMNVPAYFEGWNEIKIVHQKNNNLFLGIDVETYRRNSVESIILKNNDSGTVPTYDTLFKYDPGLMNLRAIKHFDTIYELPQDSPHHTLSVSRHTYYVYSQLFENKYIADNERLMWLWTALLHDIGKAYTKTFSGKYAHFYGHENVSAQLAIQILHRLGYDDEFILEVATFVQLHMKLLHVKEKSGLKRLEELIGPKWFGRLETFREADVNAK